MQVGKLGAQFRQFLDFPRADVSGGIDVPQFYFQGPDNFEPGRVGQGLQLLEADVQSFLVIGKADEEGLLFWDLRGVGLLLHYFLKRPFRRFFPSFMSWSAFWEASEFLSPP